jgi:hypothetical protein
MHAYLCMYICVPMCTAAAAVTVVIRRWPWDKYRLGLDQPPGGPQRTFLVLVLQQLVRLTSWDHAQLRQVCGGGGGRLYAFCSAKEGGSLCVL